MGTSWSNYKLIKSDSGEKYELSEQKFLADTNCDAETRRVQRKDLMKQAEMKSNFKKYTKKMRLMPDGVENERQDGPAAKSSTDDDEYGENDLGDEESYVYVNSSDLENDLDLLDSSDSLDQTMLNLIKSSNVKFFSEKRSKNISAENMKQNERLT